MNEQRPPSSPSVEIPVHKSAETSLRDAGALIRQARKSSQEWLANKSYRTIGDFIGVYYPALRGEMSPDWDAEACRSFLLRTVEADELWDALVDFSASSGLKPPRPIAPVSEPGSGPVSGTLSGPASGPALRTTGAGERAPWGRILVGFAVALVLTGAAALPVLPWQPEPQMLEPDGGVAQPEPRAPAWASTPHRPPGHEREHVRSGARHRRGLAFAAIPREVLAPTPEPGAHELMAKRPFNTVKLSYAIGIEYPCKNGHWMTVMFPRQAVSGSPEASALGKRAEREGKRLCRD